MILTPMILLTSKSRQEADTQIYAELKKQQILAEIENRKARYDLAVLDNPFIPETPDTIPLNRFILAALIFSTALTLSCTAIPGYWTNNRNKRSLTPIR